MPRALLVPTAAVAALTALTALAASCTLTTDLKGLSEDASDAGAGTDAMGTTTDDGGPRTDGASSDALPDGADPSKAYAAVVLADGPVAYYRLEEASDENAAKDELGTHPAVSTGAGVKFGAAGTRGRGATFDGNHALDVGDAFDFAGLQPFTLEVWVRASTAAAGGALFHKRDEGQDPFKGYIVYADNGSPHFEAWGVDLSAWNDPPLPAGFSHVVVAVRYENGKGNATLYVNAQPGTNGGFNNTISLADTPAHLRFGDGFQGVLDEIAVYDKALPADRILEHYRAGR
jgi:hypothetical protein